MRTRMRMEVTMAPMLLILLQVVVCLAASPPGYYTYKKNGGYQDLTTPEEKCMKLGQYLRHPADKCRYLRCDFGNEPWKDDEGKVRYFTQEFWCPPGLSVDRKRAEYGTTFPCIKFNPRCTGGHLIYKKGRPVSSSSEYIPSPRRTHADSSESTNSRDLHSENMFSSIQSYEYDFPEGREYTQVSTDDYWEPAPDFYYSTDEESFSPDRYDSDSISYGVLRYKPVISTDETRDQITIDSQDHDLQPVSLTKDDHYYAYKPQAKSTPFAEKDKSAPHGRAGTWQDVSHEAENGFDWYNKEKEAFFASVPKNEESVHSTETVHKPASVLTHIKRRPQMRSSSEGHRYRYAAHSSESSSNFPATRRPRYRGNNNSHHGNKREGKHATSGETGRQPRRPKYRRRDRNDSSK